MRFEKLLLSYGGCGLFPTVPGTVGTAGAAVTAALILLLLPASAERWTLLCAAWVGAAVAATVLFTPAIEAEEEKKDPQVIVMDEVAGYWATLLGTVEPDLTHLVAAFFVFRFLDVVKPWPAKALERLPHGWGVVMDDVMSGLYGAALLWGAEQAAARLF
jgi:phosphatidylglycerophosphatase A